MFPAWAGVILVVSVSSSSSSRVPRVGGGDPAYREGDSLPCKCSPRGRG